MSTAATLPADVHGGCGLTPDGLWAATFRSMASPVRILLGADTPSPQRVTGEVRELFAAVERQCTRFDLNSDLMQANAAGGAWHVVGEHCFRALLAAYDAHVLTEGTFEPRVLRTLTALGYDATWLRARRGADTAPAPALPAEPWTPDFDEERSAVRVGAHPIDLGGIGKGLALRWAAELLRARGATAFLVDAGGDVVTAGAGPDGAGWHIGVEDPTGGDAPVAVLRVAGQAIATSSPRLRRWRAGGHEVHHLIDPATGTSSHGGWDAVTVVADDPAEAEVWSKTLFVRGARIDAECNEQDLAALWVGADRQPRWSGQLADHLLWWVA